MCHPNMHSLIYTSKKKAFKINAKIGDVGLTENLKSMKI